ncbi:MAG: hypothetical protein ACT4P5_21860, partial [Armatimonadota bacterium]
MTSKVPDIIAAAHQHVGTLTIRPDQTVVILASTNTYQPIRDAVMGSVMAHGVDPLLLVIK